jgi:transcription elongation factor Elf1
MNRFIEIVKGLKRRSESTLACPRCGSLRMSKSTGMDGWLLPPLYLCGECGYAGRLVLEVERKDLAPDGK